MRLSRRTVGTMGSLQGEKTSHGARTLLFLAKLPPSFPHFHHTRSERRSASMRAYHYRYPVRLSQEPRLWLGTMRRTSRTPAKHYLVARVLLMSDQRNPGASLKRRMETLSGALKMCWTSIVNPTILRCPRSVWMKWARISSKTSIHRSQPSQDNQNLSADPAFACFLAYLLVSHHLTAVRQ